MASKEKRDRALREITHSWSRFIHRINWIHTKLQELQSKEHQRTRTVRSIKGEQIEKEEKAIRRIKSIVKEEERLSKEIEHWLEQCRLLMVHQKKKIKEFRKNL